MSKLQDIARARQSLARGVQWLLAQQGEDGGWHSATYGQLKDGAAVTALALNALSAAPPELITPHLRAMGRGVKFFDRGLAKRGTIAGPDGTLDFPTYAAALWLQAKSHFWGGIEPDRERTSVVEYLIGAQVAESRGFAASSPSYGGWDFLGPGDARAITTGTNISVTCYVLEALAAERQNVVSPSRKTAIGHAIGLGRAYVLRCQQLDGGFAFTCEPASLNNKALYTDEKLTQPRSYGTATCDGIRALVACGVKPTDERIAKALVWLEKRLALEVVPGFEGLPPEAGWQRGLRFYYYASLARVLPLFAAPAYSSRRAALIEHLLALQKADGSWVNESDRMRENDPLIATSLAVSCVARLI